MHAQRMAAVALLGWLGLLAGCGSGTVQVEVEGAVSYDGTPIPRGTISFLAADGQKRNSGGQIVDGKYTVPEETGPMTGKYTVEIRWEKPTGKKFKIADAEELVDEVKEGLPEKYNKKSELTVDFKPGKNVANFDLAK